MPGYVFADHSGKTPETVEEGAKAMAAYGSRSIEVAEIHNLM
ncbi:hypothetical protein [Roseobacter sp. A03A-229]